MESEGILIAILVVLIVIIGYQYEQKKVSKRKSKTKKISYFTPRYNACRVQQSPPQFAPPVHMTPEAAAERERSAWYDSVQQANVEGFNPERVHDMGTDTMQYHASVPAIDYDSYVTDQIIDKRMLENHRKWVSDLKPYTGTPTKIDDLDPGNYIDFRGLRRPQAVAQYDPLFVTEIDTKSLANNKKFNFQG